MPVYPLPHRPNLANIRKQAKTLLAAWQAGDDQAVTRVRQSHPRGERLERVRLADAQVVVAREYGFASWARLVQHLRLTPQAQALHAIDLLFRADSGEPSTVGQVLDHRVDLLWQAHLDGHPAVAVLLTGSPVTVDDVRAAIAREHGFADWAAVPDRDRPVDPHFEAAVDAIVSGEPDALRALLTTHPELVSARSPFGHHATLVHYVTANGVEWSRQWQSPRNAAEVMRILLHHGGDPDAMCDVYGGSTPLGLLVSSAHPANAGVQAALVEELCRGGANPNGLDEDGIPLWTAITFGYPPAVDALARCGARVDNLVFAAAVGDLPLVTGYLRDRGRITAQRIGIRGPVLAADHMIEYALIYSAGLGRRAVVELLLGSDPDLGVIEPRFHSTAAGAARYHRRHDILALLEHRPTGFS
ncbi:ankyrin repeat domain-containing protein [Actinocrispum wychmicini]|uniref:Uncharacterized protein n=1 Tax=Actinocrispum wychmicini TaxID=1213861 RepID=A0A4R2JLI3_9PSEU|nr:ankyrin repeat domain-containing protein [Actinocrispum wychmicini]TCO59727.1 hypothetical protein EV192_104570 [Actinocrispum wychmicini]